jgi:hypothetical protein
MCNLQSKSALKTLHQINEHDDMGVIYCYIKVAVTTSSANGTDRKCALINLYLHIQTHVG